MLSGIHKKLQLQLLLGIAIALSSATSAKAFDIHFDYSYDDGFFSGTEGETRRNTLEQAGRYYEDYIDDNLSAIVYDENSTTGIGYDWGGLSNTWKISFDNPATGVKEYITDPTFAEGRVTIYAGGRDLTSLGRGGAGGVGYSTISSNGEVLNQDFINLVKGRGQTGALTDPATDYSLWGGAIAFDSNLNSGFSWHNEVSDVGLETDEHDFLSVGVHEIGHVLGISGSNNSWNNQTSETGFTGTNAVAAYNQANNTNATGVPLDSGGSHWANGTEGLTVEGVTQETAFDPSLYDGQRKLLTNVDYGGLEDVGWDVNEAAIYANVPFEFSPSLGILVTFSGFGILKIKNQLKKIR